MRHPRRVIRKTIFTDSFSLLRSSLFWVITIETSHYSWRSTSIQRSKVQHERREKSWNNSCWQKPSQSRECLVHLIERLRQRLMQTQHLIFRSRRNSGRRWACKSAIVLTCSECLTPIQLFLQLESKGPGPGNWVLFWSDLKPLEGWLPEYKFLREGWHCQQVERKLGWMYIT